MKKKLFISVFIMCLIILGLFINITPNEEKLEEIKDEKMLAIYVEGVYTDEFPSTENLYKTSVKCYDSSNNLLDTNSKVVKDGDKWKVQVSNITTSAKCNVYFDEPMPDGWKDAPAGSLLAGIKENYPRAVEPWTIPGQVVSYQSYTSSISVNSTYQGYYWTYADDYEIDPSTLKFTLKGVHTVLYNNTEGDNYKTLRGKYIVGTSAASNSSETDEAKNTTGLSYLYQVIYTSSNSLIYTRNLTIMNVYNTNWYWTYGTGFKAKNNKFELTGVNTLKYSDNYQDLIGKYIVGMSYSDNSNPKDILKPTSNLSSIFQVIDAGTNYLVYKTPIESVLSFAEDDVGISYYFRGAVQDNYVVFAKMCWQILRIDGAGNIKLALYNYNANYNDNSVTNPCSSIYDSDDAGFARYNSTTNGLKGRSYYNDGSGNIFIGYMYGSSSSSFDQVHANNNPSRILTNLMTWYNTYLRTLGYDAKLADVIWCNDKSLGLLTNTGTGYGTSSTRYGAYDRLTPSSTASPTLICPDASKTSPNLSRFTASTDNGNGALTISDLEYKIGLLTADEVAFAGGGNFSNQIFFLGKNVGAYFTMSPASTGYVWLVYTNQLSYNGANTYSYMGLRPAVALKSDVQITNTSMENIGTQENPYYIQ